MQEIENPGRGATAVHEDRSRDEPEYSAGREHDSPKTIQSVVTFQ